MCIFWKGETVIDKLCLYKRQTKPFKNIYTESGLCDRSCCSKSIWVKFRPLTMYLCCHSTFYTTGKDKIIFVTKEDHETPSSAELVEEDPNDPYEERGKTSTFCLPVVWRNFSFVKFEKHKCATYILTSPPCVYPRSDSSQRGDQLELPLPWWDGQWTLWDWI